MSAKVVPFFVIASLWTKNSAPFTATVDLDGRLLLEHMAFYGKWPGPQPLSGLMPTHLIQALLNATISYQQKSFHGKTTVVREIRREAFRNWIQYPERPPIVNLVLEEGKARIAFRHQQKQNAIPLGTTQIEFFLDSMHEGRHFRTSVLTVAVNDLRVEDAKRKAVMQAQAAIAKSVALSKAETDVMRPKSPAYNSQSKPCESLKRKIP